MTRTPYLGRAVCSAVISAFAWLSMSGCAARTAAAPEIPVRIDPVQLPMAELRMSDVPLPAARAALLRLVDSLTQDTTFRMANWGVLIMDPEVGDTIVSMNAGKLFMPASNQKLVTGASALALLGPDYTWRTPVLLRGRTSGGTFRGDIVLVGSGDPSWSDAMRNGDALSAFYPIADALAARGIQRVIGRIVAEGDGFPDSPLGFGWSHDDLDAGYSAGADELMLNENFFRVVVKAGRRVGAPVTARTMPTNSYPRLRISATTRTARDTVRDAARDAARTSAGDTTRNAARRGNGIADSLDVASDSIASALEIRGSIPLGDSIVISLAYRQPNDAARAALREVLTARGVRFSAGAAAAVSARVDTLLVLESPTLREVHQRLQKPSQNQIAEALFKTIAREQTGVGTADSARAVIERQLARWGITTAEAAVRDGSGLSRHDYISPRAVVRLLTVMQSHPAFDAFYSALPIAGVDGTIASRMRGTPAAGNLRAKTGFVDKARSLSGYVNTADGHQLVFAILCNNWVGSVRDVERVQDAIGAYLASVRMQDLRIALPR